jgi:membrane-associated HD superfamily phosphohydrolase
MISNDKSAAKLLTKDQEPDHDESPAGIPLSIRIVTSAIALVTALILAFVLLPRVPLLELGEIADHDIVAPYTLSIEYPGPDQKISLQVNKGELIVGSGHQVTERAERVFREIARQEGIGNRLSAYLGLCILILAVLYLFYRDIKRYRPALISEWKKIVLLVCLLLMTIILSQSGKYVLSLLADRLHLDIMTIGFVLPVASGAMLTSLLLDFHLALGFSFVVSILLGILYPGEPFIPIYYFLGSIVAALSVIRCKKRTALLKAGGMTALINLLAIIGIDLYRGELWNRGAYDLAAGIVCAVAVSTVVSV